MISAVIGCVVRNYRGKVLRVVSSYKSFLSLIPFIEIYTIVTSLAVVVDLDFNQIVVKSDA